MKQGYLTCLSLGRYGRFMNGGYQIAGILGIAKANNLEPVFPLWQNIDHRDRFGSTEDIDLYKHFVHELPPIPRGIEFQSEQFIQWGFHPTILSPGNYNLSGHFQSPRYFENCMDQVRHYLRMQDEPEQGEYTAIHYRAGDYSTEIGYHPRLPMSYYRPAMEQIGGPFMVFSDDLNEARQMFGSDVDYSEGNYLDDFRLLKRCKSFIIGNSSYSAMAAMLGEHPDKKVIAPRPWFGLMAGITGDDIYDKDWQIINWQ